MTTALKIGVGLIGLLAAALALRWMLALEAVMITALVTLGRIQLRAVETRGGLQP